MVKKNYAVLFLCWLTYVAAYLCRLNFASALPKLAAGLNTSVEYMGIAASAYFTVYAVGQLVNGFIGDRIKPYLFIMAAAAMTALINILISLSGSYMTVTLLWACNGLCQSIFWSTILRLLSVVFPREKQKFASTVMSTSVSAGYIISWTCFGALFLGRSWHLYFIVPGIIAGAVVPLWIIMSRLYPLEYHSQARGQPLGKSLGYLWKIKVQYICLLCFCVGFIKEGLTAWIPTIFSTMLGLDPRTSPVLLLIIPIANLAGAFIARSLLGFTGENFKKTLLLIQGSSVLLCAALVFTGSGASLATVFLVGLLCALVNGSGWVIISYLPLSFAKQNMVATSVGIFDFSIYMGAALASTLMGTLMVRFGWTAVPVLWSAAALASVLLCLGGAGTFLLRDENAATGE